MKYKSYPAYKDSGIEWLGKVPKQWDVKRGRFVMSVNPPANKLRTLRDGAEVSFVPMASVGVYGGLTLEQSRVIGEVSGGYTEFQDGDVVVAKITPCFENGKGALASGLLNGAAYGTTELHVLRPGKLLNDRFLFYLSISDIFRKLGEAEMYGAGGQKRVPPEFNKDFRTPLPHIDEQRTIADFLDTQTGKLDTLVNKKRALIDKLKEKRTALISVMVTRGLPPHAAKSAGLNPNPKLKRSGINWLGDVVEHREVSPLKRLVSTPITDGPHETPEIMDDGIPFVSAESVRNNRIDFSRKRGFISYEDHRRFSLKYRPQRDDIYMVKSGATTGNLAIVDTDDDFNIWSPLAAVRTNKKVAAPRYVLYAMQSKEFQTSVQLFWSYGTQQNIGMNVIENLVIPVPPLVEQVAIADYLDQETSKIDRMIGKVEAVIEKLQEYRSALIAAAVTGKIDVREIAAGSKSGVV